MHYKLSSGVVIKTENAAKPESQSSAYLNSLLAELSPVSSAFDYGCGKLRYCSQILDKTDTLAIVNSEIQLARTQTIRGRKCSISELLDGSNCINVYTELEFQHLRKQFNRGFCINVLSIVPFLSTRRQILGTIYNHLKPHSDCLFVVQYRNSDFTRMSSLPNARPWRDGFILESLRGFSFYGLIGPDQLRKMTEKAGFKCRDLRLNEGSAYLWATRS